MMKSLVTDTAFTDVTLISEDKKYMKAHKNVLSFCSPTFKEIFSLDKSASVIYLKGVNHSEVESILQFIYLGEATFKPDRQTHRRTDRRTDRDRPGENIFSYEMTEYKNTKNTYLR